MSHANGQVIVGDSVVAYYEYNGTSDIALSCLYGTKEEVRENWRRGVHNQCTCGQESTDCLLYTDYGRGFYWPAKVCLTCRAITHGAMRSG